LFYVEIYEVGFYLVSSSCRLTYTVSSPPYILQKHSFQNILPISGLQYTKRRDRKSNNKSRKWLGN